MDPMKAPAAESPPNLRRQTRGAPGVLLVVKASEVNFEFELGWSGMGVVFSTSELASELGTLAGVAIKVKP